MSTVKLYVDHASQPSRAVIVFCRINKIPHQIKEVRISKAEHMSEEYAKINPHRKVPAIVHGDLQLAESHAILRYLARAFNVPEQWYPRTDLKKAAKIDEYLDYHHTGTRKFSMVVFWGTFAPAMGLPPPKSFNREEAVKEAEKALKFLNNVYLKNTPFIGSQCPTIADLSAYEELIQLNFTDLDYSKHANIMAWVKRMEAIPEVAEENKLFNKFLQAFKSKVQPKL